MSDKKLEEIQDIKEQKTTQYEMSSKMVDALPPLEINEKEIKAIKQKIKQIILNNDIGKYYALMSPNFNYLTIFANLSGKGSNDLAQSIADFIIEENENLGLLKDYALRENDKSIEFWFGKEVYMLFSYDQAVEEV